MVAGTLNFNSLEASRPLVLALSLTVRSIPEHAQSKSILFCWLMTLCLTVFPNENLCSPPDWKLVLVLMEVIAGVERPLWQQNEPAQFLH